MILSRYPLSRIHGGSRWLLLVVALSASLFPKSLVANEPQFLTMDGPAKDRIILNAANDNHVVEITLDAFPDRKVPRPLPTSGTLRVFRLSQPSIAYQVSWSDIAKVQLFEQIILEEAGTLASQGKTLDVFRCLQYLHENYPDMPELAPASEQFVKQEALAAFKDNDYESAMAILLTLYDLNAQHKGLSNAVRSVSDKVIKAYLAEGDFSAARGVLNMLKEAFVDLDLPNIEGWESKFRDDANALVQEARQAITQKQFDKARLSISRAMGILPDLPGTGELLQEIDKLAPRTIVAVHQLVTEPVSMQELNWPKARVSQLVAPRLVEMVGFASEGGIYTSRWAELSTDDAGLQLDLAFSPLAVATGFSPERFALSLLEFSSPASPYFATDFADSFEGVTIHSGQQASVFWKRPPVRPEALLRIPVAEVMRRGPAPGVYRSSLDPEVPEDMRYDLSASRSNSAQPRRVIERVFESEEQAIGLLRTGNIDAIDRLAPWHADQMRNYRSVTVSPYRLPSVHVLRMNYNNPLMKSREFRRALCYGIDRQRILEDVLLGGKNRLGFRILSGPLPAGTSYTDPVAYSYNQQLAPRPYEPRLASVLSKVARTALAKKQTNADSKTEEDESKPAEIEANPLRLAHPPESLARTCCQTIKLQLTAVGIPIELTELPATSTEVPEDVDLVYVTLSIREPLVDARRLLGPDGLAGICSSSMNLALQQVDQAKNWAEARERLQEVHQTAFYDLPVIPLWQTIDHFAYRRNLSGISNETVSLYQNVTQWQSSQVEGGR